ncbi:metallophosphoesterase family protein [Halopiger xanaduensis]|uniref:Metallophosphoesterase n=1 Tax=Halopiger xanaduensis (strain DSM 18323 / JCM 14033 / SH-6) TaxID=797210 RepID=F8D8Q2_HALXS|nr:metallophosphoesterase [Halopiger xanaduensis]AEH36811.1 metallophosphoesterase [Halopiger xanaduensis SH-6]
MLVLGDAHAADPARRETLLELYRRVDPDRVLQVGDLEYYDLPAPTWFIAGNNEDFDVIESMRANERPFGESNVHLLASTAATVDGVRVAGLSGNYAPTKYDQPRSKLAGERRRHFTREDVERARDLENVDVFLTHEAPTGLLSYGYDPGCEHVDDLLEAIDPELCLVGHHHEHRETELGETRVVSLAPAWERYYTLDSETLELEGHDHDLGPTSSGD